MTAKKLSTNVLDKGFVKLIDHYGDDQSIVEAARVSISGEGVEATSKTRGLLRYLMRHRHTTPFEMVDFKFHIKCPIFVARQWMRHRTFSYNEMSARYSELPQEFYVPEPDKLNKQSKTNNQGRDGDLIDEDPEHDVTGMIDLSCSESFQDYNEFLQRGLTREVARTVLPVGAYTEFYVKGNLHNWMHFLSLRMDSHAQYEIRVYADAIAGMIAQALPLTWEAFEDYRLNGLFLTSYDVAALTSMIAGDGEWNEDDFPTKREFKEHKEKLLKLGIGIPE